MASPLDLAQIDAIVFQAREYFFQHVLSWAMAAQLAAIGGALLLARQATGAMRAWLTRQQAQFDTHPEAGADLAILLEFVKVIDSFLAFLLVVVAWDIASHFNWTRNEMFIVGIILLALAVTRLFTDKMKNRFWARILASAIWVYAFFLYFPQGALGASFTKCGFSVRASTFISSLYAAGFCTLVGSLLDIKKSAHIFPFLADS
jgi:hypothetical protein